MASLFGVRRLGTLQAEVERQLGKALALHAAVARRRGILDKTQFADQPVTVA